MADEKRDYVQEAYEAFIVNAHGLDPTDPVTAIENYFSAHASDGLKERVRAEGKTAASCWKFIEAVARKIGGNCYIDPGAIYGMTMHYFEDVPENWDESAKPAAKPAEPAKTEKPAKPKPPKPPKKPRGPQQASFLDALGGES